MLNSLKLALATMVAALPPIPELAVGAPAITARDSFTLARRTRVPHSNRAYRKANGIPHGTPGTKLARRAAAGRIGL